MAIYMCSVPNCSNPVDPPRSICAHHYAIGLRESAANMCLHCGQRECQKISVFCTVCEAQLKGRKG